MISAQFLQATEIAALDAHIIADLEARNYNGTEDILVLNDVTTALTIHALQMLDEGSNSRVFVRVDSYATAWQLHKIRQKLPANMRRRLLIAGLSASGEHEVETAKLSDFLQRNKFAGCHVFGRLPKSRAALREWADAVAAYGIEHGITQMLMLLGGNVKHMTFGFNTDLEASYVTVVGLRGKGKHRCLLATTPAVSSSDVAVNPDVVTNSGDTGSSAAAANPDNTANELPQAQVLYAYGGVFAGEKPDAGGQLLAAAISSDVAGWAASSADAKQTMQREAEKTYRLLDLGCGNGAVIKTLAADLQLQRLAVQWHATDIDLDAVVTATQNLREIPNCVVTWGDAAQHLPANSFDVVALNPPFHIGTKVDYTLVKPLLQSSLRVLKPGGKLYLVHNSHARYRSVLEKQYQGVTQLIRNSTFTVLRGGKSG